MIILFDKLFIDIHWFVHVMAIWNWLGLNFLLPLVALKIFTNKKIGMFFIYCKILNQRKNHLFYLLKIIFHFYKNKFAINFYNESITVFKRHHTQF